MGKITFEILVVVGLALLGIAIAIGVTGLLLMWGWNSLAPIFWAAAPTLTFWQCVLAGIVLGIIFGDVGKYAKNWRSS